MKKMVWGILILLSAIQVFGQSAARKNITATRIEQPPKIDGVLDEVFWNENANTFNGKFIGISPRNGEEDPLFTEFTIVYTDYAIYIGAKMHDDEPGKIPTELASRDNLYRNADYFGIVFDTYDKGQNGAAFYVTSAGVQTDALFDRRDDDDSWNEVWTSEVSITDDGWVVEMEIPYRAIRFPKNDIQKWGFNAFRYHRRTQRRSSWNFIDRQQNGVINQSGELNGIEHVKPPLRLSFMPYVSGLRKSENGQTNQSVSGGMDLKYGINQSFTLDLTLIPDFSQVRSDNLVLNLSPFEVRFNENRPFFTEGVELFNKGQIFYSRRVGRTNGSPDDSRLQTDEEILNNPANAPLINATKVSGRTVHGTGLGIFNAVTAETFSEVENTISGVKRNVLVDPRTNFNVFVIDQNLKNNSNLGFINTNVYRGKEGRNANVSVFEGTLRDPSNTYSIYGGGGYSTYSEIEDGERISNPGYKYFLYFSKVSGNFQFNAGHQTETDTWEINDLGFQRRANEMSSFVNLRYNIYQPFSIFNNLFTSIDARNLSLYAPRKYQEFGVGTRVRMEFTNFWEFTSRMSFRPVDSKDYYEPRVSGEDFGQYFFLQRPSVFMNWDLETDSRKALRFQFGYNNWSRRFDNASSQELSIEPRFRANDRLTFSTEANFNWNKNNKGYVNKDEGLNEIYFGNRDINTLDVELALTYSFNTKMDLFVRARNYWSRVNYTEYFQLGMDGELNATSYTGNDVNGVSQHDTDYSVFNVDIVYTWQIAPGSFFTATYKTFREKENQDISTLFLENFGNTLDAPGNNTFSLKLIYFLDYSQIFHGKK